MDDPELVAAREAAGRPLPKYVQDEFAVYLKCGRLEHGFLRVRCEDCRAEKLFGFSCKRRLLSLVRSAAVRCGGRLQVIASIEEPELIERILAHRRERGDEDAPAAPLKARAPPQALLF